MALTPLRLLRRRRWAEQEPTWREAAPGRIEAALGVALARPSGGWFVLAAATEVRPGRAFGRTVAGREVVAWRGPDGAVHAGPGACPHLGAPLCSAPVHDGRLVCRWHGLALGPEGRPGWRVLPVHDDGLLVWVRLDDLADGAVSERPYLGPRPSLAGSVATVATVVGRCTPDDVLANRLDPWHGVWLHPYSFAQLRVLDHAPELFRLEVTYSVAGRLGIPVIAEFTCPDPRTATMQIVDGEGVGSGRRDARHAARRRHRRAAPHRRDRGGRRPLRPARVRRGRARRRRAASGDAVRGAPALARRPRLRRAALRAAVGTEVAITPSIRGSCAGWR